MEKEIVDYMVVVDDSSNFLEEVRKAIAEGWQPFGGLVVTSSTFPALFSQAMVKYKKQ